MQALASLHDDSRWDEVVENLPVFTTHVAYSKTVDGKVRWKVLPLNSPEPGDGWEKVYSVTEKDLEKISDNINAELNDSGAFVKLLEGHTIPQAGQDAQPKLLGFGVGAKVGEFGPGKKKAVLIKKAYIRAGCGERARELPERSAEFDYGRRKIRTIALIKSDPRLSLGTLVYHDDSEKTVFYSQGLPAMATATMEPEPTKVPPSAADQHKNPMPPQADDDDDAGDDADMRKFVHFMEKCYPEFAKKYGMAPAPAPANGAMPPMPPKKPMATEEKAPMAQGATTPVEYADESSRFQLELEREERAKLDKRMLALEAKEKRLNAEVIVKKLRYEDGVAMTVKEAEDLVLQFMGLDEQQTPVRYEEIVYKWPKDPTAGGPGFGDINHGPLLDGGPQLKAADMTDVVKYCEDHGMDYDKDDDYKVAVEAVTRKKHRR